MNKVRLFGVQPKILISKKVAIVGNSNSLLSKKYGREINSFPDIIRFNFAELKREYTGTKTTLRWFRSPININSAKQHKLSIDSDEKLAMYVKQLTKNTRVLTSYIFKSKLEQINKDIKFYNIDCVYNDFDVTNKYLRSLGVKTQFENRKMCWPRTGFLAVLICLKSGAKPYLYGFDLEHKKYIKHYGTNYVFSTDNIKYHQVSKEINILLELKNLGMISVN